MPARLSAALLPLLLSAAALLPGCTPDQAPATAPLPPPTAVGPPPAQGPPELRPGYGTVLECLQELIVLPLGTPVPADTSRVVVRFEVRSWGSVAEVRVVQGLSPAVDSAVVAAMYQLPFPNGQSMTVDSIRQVYTLTVVAPGAASPAQRREATTRWQRTAVRRPGEADTTFVRRVLPLSFPHNPWREADDLQALAWRPSPYGRQLVFAAAALRPRYDNSSGSPNWYDTDVFVLDPFGPRTYAVQRFHIANIGDLNSQSATPFVADANGDGRPDLLVLVTYSQSEDGGHLNYYRVVVWRTAGLDARGRPRYRPDNTPYPYLEYRQDETPGPRPAAPFTPATVRRALARHQHRQAPKARQ